jgi:carbon-monoxide dehydrogenase small subunit
MTEKEKDETKGISRREFLRDASIVAGGAAVGTAALLTSCNGGGATTTTVTKTVTGPTVTTTVAGASAAVIPGLITLNVNGKNYNVTVDNEDTLAYTIREKCLLPGVKVGCNRGECGTCTVLIDGKPIYSCLVLAIEAVGKKIETVESLGVPNKMSKLQAAFVENHALQCGFCIPGFLMTSTALLRKTPTPTVQQAKEAVAGHFCYCGCMTRIIKTLTTVGGP